jgi:putative aldouronate transport system permease protein
VHISRTVKRDRSGQFVASTSYIFIIGFALICIFPFAVMVASSFTTERSILTSGYNLWPREFSTDAYKLVLADPDRILGSYIVTIVLTGTGTFIGLFLISMAGYALQRPDFAYRNRISFFVYFTTLFTGGLVPYFLLMTRYLKLKDNYLAVLLPLLMNPWLVILMKNFMKSIPHSITESAKMDGATDFRIYLSLILPLAKPGLATVGLFLALGYWNEWYNSMLFLSPNVKYRPLQLLLYNIITSADFIRNSAAASNIPPQDVPAETMKMAAAVIATGPIIALYPFVQKYFIAGITIGSVKG